jgi:hypothetical protein
MKTSSIAFVVGHKKEQWIRKTDRCGGLYEIRFVQGPQELKMDQGKRYNRD